MSTLRAHRLRYDSIASFTYAKETCWPLALQAVRYWSHPELDQRRDAPIHFLPADCPRGKHAAFFRCDPDDLTQAHLHEARIRDRGLGYPFSSMAGTTLAREYLSGKQGSG